MRVMEFERVAVVQDEVTAGTLISRLQAEGMHPPKLRTSPHVHFAGPEHGYYIEVPDTEVDAARTWFREHGFGSILL